MTRNRAGAEGSADGDLERVLREQTDVFTRDQAILAIAPEPDIERILGRLPRVRARRAAERIRPTVSVEDAEAFDLAIDGAGALERVEVTDLGALARMLRPGGRIVVRVRAAAAAGCAQRLAGAGFLVARAAEGCDSIVLVAVRGEFAAYAQRESETAASGAGAVRGARPGPLTPQG